MITGAKLLSENVPAPRIASLARAALLLAVGAAAAAAIANLL